MRRKEDIILFNNEPEKQTNHVNIPDPCSRDVALKNMLNSLSSENEDYWSFAGKTDQEHAHLYLHYPAMMVPELLGQLIRTLKTNVPEGKTVFDPYLGSGTTMTESMLEGLDFIGNDINPLAYLLCKVKSGPLFHCSLKEKAEKLLHRLRAHSSKRADIAFKGLEKWFRTEIAADLSQIRRAIMAEDSRWARRFFWICLAETVRLTSNSRTSTFKLHVRPTDEILNRVVETKLVFKKVLKRNIEQLTSVHGVLKNRNLLSKDTYSKFVSLYIGDSSYNVANGYEQLADFLITSPPYGDNRTTVPYGQFSYLPLQWIPLSDIHPRLDASFLSTTCNIDTRSLGGITKNALQNHVSIREKSPSLSEIVDELKKRQIKLAKRVAAFYVDFDRSLDAILQRLKPNSYMIWIVGNRRVGGLRIPFNNILVELLEARGALHLLTIDRRIPSKRMAIRNDTTETMRNEKILIMRKRSMTQ
jgi:hypothetical protein